MQFSIRSAIADDADVLGQIHLNSWRWAYDKLLPASFLEELSHDQLAARWWLRLSTLDCDESVRVVEVDGQIAGFSTFGPHQDDPEWLDFASELHMIYLQPEWVGLGLGTRLLRDAFADLTRKRCHWVMVWVLCNNSRAREFYECHGLVPDGHRRWDNFGDQTLPVMRYARALNPVVDFGALAAGDSADPIDVRGRDTGPHR